LLSAAPQAGEGERAGVQGEWEQRAGGLVAALRYAVMSLPSPSEKEEEFIEDPRARLLGELVKQSEERTERPAIPGVDYSW
jgi:hypothetical protein